MRANEIKQRLLRAMGEMEIIDSHEHLGPERERLKMTVDVFTLVSHYIQFDIQAAGMPKVEFDSLLDSRIPLEVRWAAFKPYWKNVRWGSYARAAILSARKFYGFEVIDDTTYRPLSEAMQENNRSGIYERVLRDACKIRTALTQCGSTDLKTPLLTPIMPLLYDLETWDELSHPVFDQKMRIRSLEDYLEAIHHYVLRVKTEGAVGLKTVSNPYGEPKPKEAHDLFQRLNRGVELRLPPRNALRDYLIDKAVSFAAEENLVIAVHTGYWGDFRELDPLHMIPLIQRHPNARFDIYHLGFPWIRETLMLGKGFPNVWLNLCWTHIISQRMATSALDEAIDLIPMNKLLAFGGDYHSPVVEKIYGHLVMARENIARVLARRVAEKSMTETEAIEQIEKWFWQNPKELYGLKV